MGLPAARPALRSHHNTHGQRRPPFASPNFHEAGALYLRSRSGPIRSVNLSIRMADCEGRRSAKFVPRRWQARFAWSSTVAPAAPRNNTSARSTKTEDSVLDKSVMNSCGELRGCAEVNLSCHADQHDAVRGPQQAGASVVVYTQGTWNWYGMVPGYKKDRQSLREPTCTAHLILRHHSDRPCRLDECVELIGRSQVRKHCAGLCVSHRLWFGTADFLPKPFPGQTCTERLRQGDREGRNDRSSVDQPPPVPVIEARSSEIGVPFANGGFGS